MSKPHDRSDNVAESNGLAWLLISLVSVVILTLVLPFPISFLVSLIVIFSLSIIRANIVLKKAGMGGINGWHKSFSSYSGRGWGGGGDSFSYNHLTFYCMRCGNPHNKIACPKCGSKAVRASWYIQLAKFLEFSTRLSLLIFFWEWTKDWLGQWLWIWKLIRLQNRKGD